MTDTPKKNGRRKWKRWVGVGLLLTLAVGVAIPFVFTNRIVRFIISRTPYARFSPAFASATLHASGQLDITDLTLRDMDVAANPLLLHVDHVTITFHWLDLFRPRLQSVEATGLVAYIRPGDSLPLSITQLANPAGHAATAAPAPTTAKTQNGFRCDAVHVSGRIELSSMDGLALPSETWTLDGTVASLGPDGATTVSVEGSLHPQGLPGEETARSGALAFHLQSNAAALNMSAEANDLALRASGPLLMRFIPINLGSETAAHLDSLRCGMAQPHGALGTWWVETQIPEITIASDDRPMHVVGLIAGGDGTLATAAFHVRHCTIDSFDIANRQIHSLRAVGGLDNHRATLDSADFEIAGGHLNIHAAYDLRAQELQNVAVNLLSIQASDALALWKPMGLPLDARINATLTADSLSPLNRAAGWPAGLHWTNAAANGQFTLTPIAGLTLPSQSWNFAAASTIAPDASTTANLTLSAAGIVPESSAPPAASETATAPAAGPQIRIAIKQDKAALSADIAATQLTVAANDALLHRLVPTLKSPPSRVMATVTGFTAGITHPLSSAPNAFWYEISDFSARTPSSSDTPIQVTHVVAGGDGQIPADSKDWRDDFFAVRHFAMDGALLGVHQFGRIELSAMLKEHTLFIPWLNAGYAGGQAKGYGQYDLSGNTLTQAGVELSRIDMHTVLAKLAPDKVDAQGIFSGNAELHSGATPELEGGNVVLTANGPGILHVHDVPGLKETIASGIGNQYLNAALAELSDYHYVTGKVTITSAGRDTRVDPDFIRDMNAPAVPLAGGIDRGGATLPAQARIGHLRAIPVTIHGPTLREILTKAVDPAAFFSDLLSSKK